MVRICYDNHRSLCENIPNTNKRFDIDVGDRVKINRNADADGKYWRVTAVYENLFMCESRYGEKTSFTKKEYILNEIVKVRDFTAGKEQEE